MKKGWEMKTLGDLYDITSSKRVFESEWKRSGVPFYRAREIVKLARQGFVDNELYISEEMYNQYSEKYGIPKEDDIMVTGVGTLGICYVVKKNDRFYFKDGNIIWLKKNSDINSRFVEYAFQSDFLRKQIDNSVGATVGTYTIIKAKSTLIPIPPLPEQQRIVALLDETFAGLAQVHANAERNLVNAREVFEVVLEDSLNNDIWEEKRLDEICEVKDGTHDTPKYVDDGIPFVTQKNIREEGLSFEDTKFIDLSDHEKYYKRSNVFWGDILISMIGANRGMACIVDDKRVFSIKNVGLIKSSENINQSYLLYFLKSPRAKKYISENSKGGAQEFIGLTELRKFPVLIPPLEEQRAIVERLDALAAETSRLEAVYQSKLEAVEELRKSILNEQLVIDN